jgi:hypothetical protein
LFPSVVTIAALAFPTAQATLLSTAVTQLNDVVGWPGYCGFHDVPLTVFRTMPFEPTAHAVFASIADTEVKLAVTPDVCRTQPVVAIDGLTAAETATGVANEISRRADRMNPNFLVMVCSFVAAA